MPRNASTDQAQHTRRAFLEISSAAVTAGLTRSTVSASPAPPSAAQSPTVSRAGGDLSGLTIAEAARRISRRQLSPVELTEATLARITTLNPKVGAFITVAAEQALDAARAAEREIQQGRYRGPLHGIPVGVKDTHYTKGILTTAATPVLKDFVPDFDCAIVERMKNAGAILVGKLNLPEFSFGGYTPGCNNPWDLTRNAGGSSGGSGAALAASLLLGATGGDTSGSIRNPASNCGVVGLKPTFGVVSRYGVVPISWTLDHLGPMARTVEDTALILTVIAGHDPRDRFSAPGQVPDYLRLLRRNIRGLRLGVIAPEEIAQFHPETKSAFLAAVKVLEGLGATTRPVSFPERMKVASGAGGIIRICEAAAYHRQFLATEAASRLSIRRRPHRPGRLTGENHGRGRLVADGGTIPSGTASPDPLSRRYAQGVRASRRPAEPHHASARRGADEPSRDVSHVVEPLWLPGDLAPVWLFGPTSTADWPADCRQAVPGCAGPGDCAGVPVRNQLAHATSAHLKDFSLGQLKH